MHYRKSLKFEANQFERFINLQGARKKNNNVPPQQLKSQWELSEKKLVKVQVVVKEKEGKPLRPPYI